MDALRYSKGIAIPDDIQVVGFDDEATAAYDAYQLTSVRQPMSAMLHKAVNLARNRINEPDSPKQQLVMKSDVVQRRSATWDQSRNRLF